MQTSRPIRVLVLTLSLMAALPLIAQQPTLQDKTAQQPTQTAANTTPTAVLATAKEVSLLAIVRDKKGQQVNTLTQQDFVLQQDGRTQAITQFARETDQPLTLGILADTGPGQHKELADERKADTDFVNHLLRENKDKGFVLHFDKEVELLQDITTSHDKLAKGINEISVGEQDNSGFGRHGGDDSGRPHYFFGGGLLYDAVYLSADEVLKGQRGRKAIVLFSDGVDRSSKMSLERAIEAAQRANTLIYCVYVPKEREEQQPGGFGGGRHGGGFPGGGPFPGGGGPFPGGGRRGPTNEPQEAKVNGKKVLQRIAQETGGRYFEVSKKMTAAQIYSQVEDELRHQYSLSYTPDKAESGYHKVHLTTKNGDLTVQTREGFYSE